MTKKRRLAVLGVHPVIVADDYLEVVQYDLKREIDKWAGVELTGRDISQDLANLDISLTAFRDAIKEYLSRVTEVAVDTGYATSGSVTSIVDTNKDWEVDKWKDSVVEVKVEGKHYYRTITGNSATELTIDPAVDDAVAEGDWYAIRSQLKLADIDRWGGTELTGRDISLDLKALTDDSIKGLLKSLGDIADLENLITRIGQTSDAIAAVGAEGSLSAKLRRATQGLEDLKTAIVLAAGSNIIGQVGIDQTMPGTTDRVTSNLDKVSGTSQTARDWSEDFAKLDLALTDLRDAITGSDLDAKTLNDLKTVLDDIKIKTDNLDVAMSTRALEAGGNLATLAGKDFATETTLAAQLNITLSALRDAVCAAGADAKTLNDLNTAITALRSAKNLDDIVTAIEALRTTSTLDTIETAIAAVQTSTDALRTTSTLDDIVTAVEALRTAKTIDDIEAAVKALRTTGTLDDIITAIEAFRTTATLDTLETEVKALRTTGTLDGIISAIQGAFEAKSAHDESTGAALDVTLDTGQYGGRSFIEVWVKSNGAASFLVQASRNGTDWRDIETIVLAEAGEEHRGYQNAYRHLKVSTSDENDNEIEIVASR